MSDAPYEAIGAPGVRAPPKGPRGSFGAAHPPVAKEPDDFGGGSDLPPAAPEPPAPDKSHAADRERQSAKLPHGLRELQEMNDLGFDAQAIAKYKAEETQQMMALGIKAAEITAYWGDNDPDLRKLTTTLSTNISAARPAKSWDEMFHAGLQMSTSSLPFGPPNIVAPEHQATMEKILTGAGMMVGDLPLATAGFVAGLAAGTAGAGGPANPLSPVAGAVIGGAFSAGLPAGLRAGLMDYYTHAGPQAESWSDIWARASGILLDVTKATATGAVMGGVGHKVGGLVSDAGGTAGAATAANLGAAAAAGTVAGAALEGRVPEADDFIVAATLAIGMGAGMGAAGHIVGARERFVPSKRTEEVAANARDIYAATGMLPKDVVEKAQTDPALASDLLAPRAADGSFVGHRLNEIAPPEPEPHTPEGQVKLPDAFKPPAATNAAGAEPAEGPPRPPASSANILGPYATGNARVGGPSGVERINTEFANRIDRMAQAMPPEIKARFEIISGFRDPARQAEVNPGVTNSHHSHGVAVDTTNDPTVIKWINEHGHEYGVGYTINHLPNEQNHLEPTENGQRVPVGKLPNWVAHNGRTGSVLEIPTKGEEVSPDLLKVFHTLEGSGTHAISPAGAIGRGQIMPGTAKQYGFDPSRLQEPGYNEMVTRHVIADLAQKFGGNLQDMLVAYNAGPGRARAWIAGGRRTEDLPVETQHYLENAERKGFLDKGYVKAQADRQLTVQGDDGKWMPPEESGRTEPPPLAESGFGGRGGEPPEPPTPRTAEPGEEPPRIAGPQRSRYADLSDEAVLSSTWEHNVGEAPETKSVWLRAREAIADQLGDFERQLAAAKRWDTEHGVGPDGIGAESMLRQTFASKERYGHFVRWGPIDALTLQPKVDPATGKKVDTSLVKAFQAVKEDGGNIKDFLSYLIGHRNVELRMRGIESGGIEDMDKENFRPSIDAKYKRAADIWREARHSVVDYGTESGLFSRVGGEAMKELNQYHLHYRRMADPGYEESSYKIGRNFAVRQATREIKGSERQIVSPLAATLESDQAIIAMADRNRAIGSIINQQKGLPPEQALFQNVTNFEPRRNASGRILDERGKPIADDWLDANGKPVDPGNVPEDVRAAMETFEIYRAARGMLKRGDFLYFNEGKPEIWHTDNPGMADLLSIASHAPPKLIQWTFGAVARVQRSGIALPLDFPIRSLSYGALSTAAFVSEASKIPFRETLAGLKHVWTESESFREMIAAGGTGTAISDMDANYLASALGDITRGVPVSDKLGNTSGVWNVFRHPIEAVRALHHIIDASGRMGFYNQRIEAGDSPQVAAMKARTAYLDYAEGRSAAWLRTWASYTPFMESAFKDLGQVSAALHTKAWAPAVGRALMVLSTPGVAFWALNQLTDQALPEHERWSEIPEDERDRFWIAPPILGYRLRIPKPPGPGLLFTSMPERLLSRLAGSPNDTSLAQAIWDQIAFPFVPALVTPIAESATDHILYRNTSLVPAALENVSAYEKFLPYTTETAKGIARVLGPEGIGLASGSSGLLNRAPLVNPIATERFVAGWTGTLPLAVAKWLEYPIKPVARPWENADLPVVGAFFHRNQGSRESIEEFYRQANVVEATAHDFTKEKKTGDISGISESRFPEAAVGGAMAGGSPLHRIKQAISMSRGAVDAIGKDPQMHAYEKRQQINSEIANQVEAARQGLEMLKAMRQQ